MGLEALSRGAASCLFVEQAEPALAAIRANLEALGVSGSARLLRQDATRLPRRPEQGAPFDFAFLDPPYGRGLGEIALMALAAEGWLAQDAVTVLERGAGEAELKLPGFETLDQRRYGAANVMFLRPGR
jgi:16S rRNA (guanine966-N2)-methyltransferase